MNTIWKYDIPEEGLFDIEMPKDAKILSIGVQHKEPKMWVQVDTKNEKETRSFAMFRTGYDMDRVLKNLDLKYLGTFLVSDDKLVFHLFEIVGAS